MNSTKTNPRKPKLNVRLLRRIKRHILEEPKRFVMSAAVIRADSQADWTFKTKHVFCSSDISLQRPSCGTAACIAGWADILTGGTGTGINLRETAARALNIDAGNSWVNHPLFFARNWPKCFAIPFARATRPSRRAKIAADRIEHLIKTGE